MITMALHDFVPDESVKRLRPVRTTVLRIARDCPGFALPACHVFPQDHISLTLDDPLK